MNNDTNQFYNQNDYNNELSSLNYNDGKKNNSGTKIFIMSIVFLLLVIAGGVIFMAMKDKKGWFASSDADSQVYLKNVNLSIGDGVITYIPLDDRPVNVERVQYLADMAGYKLAMPNKAYYSTVPNFDKEKTKAGNPKKLAEFLLRQEADGCDYYIISLDQLFSGGLMSSRAFLDEDFDDGAVEDAFKALEYIMSKKENKVYLFDTLLRLASSSNYYGFSLEEDYGYTRLFFSAPRKILNDNELTYENVYNSYKELDTNSSRYGDYSLREDENYRYIKNGNHREYKISKTTFERCLKIRERKLQIFERYIKFFDKKKADTYLLIGTDDTVVDKDNVQVNEIAYVNKMAGQYIKNFRVMSSVDESGMLLLSRLAIDASDVDLKINIEYFTDKSKVGSDYHNESIEEDLGNLMEIANVSEGDANNSLFDVLVWAYDPTINNKTTKEELLKDNKQKYYDMVNKYIDNIDNNRLTVIIDDCEGVPSELKTLNLDLLNNAPVGYLIGYSSWNTMSNASGIALAQGIVRSLYLASNEQNNESDFAFLKSMVFGFVKDLGYKRYVSYNSVCGLTENNPSLNNLVNCMNNNSVSHVGDIINNLKNSNYVSDIGKDGKFIEKGIADIYVNNYHFPWYRRFEINFDIRVDIKDSINEVYKNKLSLESNDNNNEKKQEIIDNNKKDSSNSKKDSSTDVTIDKERTIEDKKSEKKDDKKEDSNNNNNDNEEKYTKSITHYAYIDLNNGSFALDETITRAEFAKWICRANNISPVTKYEKVFADVNKSTTYWQYIIAANKAGYLVGAENSNYRPDSLLTRAEAITALLRISEQKGIVYTRTCSTYMADVSSNAWYYDAMRTGAYYCILEGNEKKQFKPIANVTKAELSAMIYRTLQRSHDGYTCDLPSSNPFSNIKSNHWAYTYLLDAYKTHTCKK